MPVYIFKESFTKETRNVSASFDNEAKEKVKKFRGELYKKISIENILEENFIISHEIVCFFVKINLIQRVYTKEEAKQIAKTKSGEFYLKLFFEKVIF